MRSNQIMLLIINFKLIRICLIICFVSTSYTLDTKKHYYFDSTERKYFHLSATLTEAQKQFIHQKIESEINFVKKIAAANNIVLLLTTALSTIFAANTIHTRQRLTDEVDQHNVHIGIILTGITAFHAIRCYASKNDINKKIAKLLFKQSLLAI